MALKSSILRYPEIASFSQSSITLQRHLESFSWSPSSEEITSLGYFKDFWISASSDKSLKFFRVNWETKTSSEAFEIKHKKKISNICSNSCFLFFADKTGEVWRVKMDSVSSGVSENLSSCDLFVGHQASIELLWCDDEHLVSVDQEYKIKVTRIREFGVIENILLGHTCKITASVKAGGRIISCDEQGNLIFWASPNVYSGVRLNEPVSLHLWGEKLLGISNTCTYLVDLECQQVIPIDPAPVLLDYPKSFILKDSQFQEITLKFELD
jgi:hypothetical protein